MKKELLKVRASIKTESKRVLSKEELAFIIGGRQAIAVLAGSGTSSTSGDACCDATCVCKREM